MKKNVVPAACIFHIVGCIITCSKVGVNLRMMRVSIIATIKKHVRTAGVAVVGSKQLAPPNPYKEEHAQPPAKEELGAKPP